MAINVRDEFYADLEGWIVENHPKYKGCKARSFHWEYDLGCLPQEIANMVNDRIWAGDEDFHGDDFKGLIERTVPPEGFAYVTVTWEGQRVGFNVPCSAFQKKESA